MATALEALLLVNEQLEAELAQLYAVVTPGLPRAATKRCTNSERLLFLVVAAEAGGAGHSLMPENASRRRRLDWYGPEANEVLYSLPLPA